jgi:spore maturation protein CgeB
MVLDIREGDEYKDFYLTPRVFEVSACGTFILTEQNSGFKELYKIGEELVCYSNLDEMINLVHYYLEHPDEREEIAQRAQKRTYQDHTFEKRFSHILSQIEVYG